MLAAKAIKDLKATRPQDPQSQSAIYDACEAFAQHIEKDASMFEVRAERSSTLSAVDLGNLIATKTAVRDDYYRSRDRVEKAREASMNDIVAKKKQYDKLAAKVAAEEVKLAKVCYANEQHPHTHTHTHTHTHLRAIAPS